MTVLGLAIELVLFLVLVCLLIRLVVDYIQLFARSWSPRGPLLVLLEGVYSLTDPPLRTVRRVIPPLNLGGMRLDLSFMVVIVIVIVLRAINQRVLLG